MNCFLLLTTKSILLNYPNYSTMSTTVRPFTCSIQSLFYLYILRIAYYCFELNQPIYEQYNQYLNLFIAFERSDMYASHCCTYTVYMYVCMLPVRISPSQMYCIKALNNDCLLQIIYRKLLARSLWIVNRATDVFLMLKV